MAGESGGNDGSIPPVMMAARSWRLWQPIGNAVTRSARMREAA
jgi:hypothetical protein